MSDPCAMAVDPSPYRCERWRRLGHDRLYVSDPAAGPARERIGYRDLLTGDDHPTSPSSSSVLAAVADHWEAVRSVPAPAPAPADPSRTS